ncbi:hypothetical protein ScPMuIL_012118 [Solemya velum]
MGDKQSQEFISILISRSSDSKFLLLHFEENGLWLPTCRRHRNDSSSIITSATDLFEKVTGVKSQLQGILKTHFIRLVNHKRDAVHITFNSSPLTDTSKCDQDAVWLDEQEMEEQSNNKAPGLLSREPIRLAKQLQEGDVQSSLNETSIDYVEVEADTSNTAPLVALLKSAKMGKDEQELLYDDFMTCCLPSTTMNLPLFSKYLVNKGAKLGVIRSLFRLV